MARADPVVLKPCGCAVLGLLSPSSIFVGLAGPGRGVTACKCSDELQ